MEAPVVATIAAGTSAKYYLARTEYYLGGREPPGRWIAVGVDAGITIGSIVEKNIFEQFHAALDANGNSMLRNDGGITERVGGYDITFSAPKSCSILYALADDNLRAQLEDAQAHAVHAAIMFLERNAAFCRSGKAGYHRTKTRLTVAAFQHAEARPAEHNDGRVFADCALHTHAVALNLGVKDGPRLDPHIPNKDKYHGALDGKALFAFKMAAGSVYHLELSKHLSQNLGFAILDSEIGNGTFELDGFDENKQLRTYFSARRNEIESELDALGLTSGEAPALAATIAKVTRKSKSEQTKGDRFNFWQDRARELGFERQSVLDTCLAAGRLQQATLQRDRQQLIAERLANIPALLTEHESTFEWRSLYAAVASALVGTGEGVARVDSEVARISHSGAIVALDRDVWGHEIYSTPDILRIEREIGEMAIDLSRRMIDAPNAALVERLIKRHNLNAEQADAARAATNTSAITIVTGAPGVGKTHMLKCVAEAWQQVSGYRVVGSASAWKIATMLRDDLSIEARATDSWIALASNGGRFVDEKVVVILDEAGLLSSRQIFSVLKSFKTASDRGANNFKLICVGDPDQLPAVGAGPGLGLLSNSLAITKVKEIVRQRDPYLKAAILNFGKGHAADALAAFEQHGHLHEVAGAKATVKHLVDAWESKQSQNPNDSCLLIAKTNVQVRAISAEVRRRLRDRGELRGEDFPLNAVTSSGHSTRLPLAVGDSIRFLTRVHGKGFEVINGTQACIENIQGAANSPLRITASVGAKRFTFTPEMFADNKGRVRIAHAYATTIYGSQGLTTDRAFVWLAPEMNRHDVYVASSRARQTTDLFFDQKALDARAKSELPLSERQGHQIDADVRQDYLARQLSRSSVKISTLDVLMAAEERFEVQGRLLVEQQLAKSQRIAARSRRRSRELSIE